MQYNLLILDLLIFITVIPFSDNLQVDTQDEE